MKNRAGQKLLSWLLTFVLVVGLLPTMALAEVNTITSDQTWSENVTISNNNDIIKITGSDNKDSPLTIKIKGSVTLSAEVETTGYVKFVADSDSATISFKDPDSSSNAVGHRAVIKPGATVGASDYDSSSTIFENLTLVQGDTGTVDMPPISIQSYGNVTLNNVTFDKWTGIPEGSSVVQALNGKLTLKNTVKFMNCGNSTKHISVNPTAPNAGTTQLPIKLESFNTDPTGILLTYSVAEGGYDKDTKEIKNVANPVEFATGATDGAEKIFKFQIRMNTNPVEYIDINTYFYNGSLYTGTKAPQVTVTPGVPSGSHLTCSSTAVQSVEMSKAITAIYYSAAANYKFASTETTDLNTLNGVLNDTGLTAAWDTTQANNTRIKISGDVKKDVDLSKISGWPTPTAVEATSGTSTYATVNTALEQVTSSGSTITATGTGKTPVTNGNLKSGVTLTTDKGSFTAKSAASATIDMTAEGAVTLKSGALETNGSMTAAITGVGTKSFSAVGSNKYTVDTSAKTLTLGENGSVKMGDKVTFTGAANDVFTLGKTEGGNATTATVPGGASVKGSTGATITGVAKDGSASDTTVQLDANTGEPTLIAGKGKVTGPATVKAVITGDSGGSKTVAITVPTGEYTIDLNNVPPVVGTLKANESVTIDGITYTAGAAGTTFPIGESKLTNTGDKATVPANTAAAIALGNNEGAPTVTVPNTNSGETVVTKGDTTTPTTVQVPANGKFTLNGEDYVAGSESATFVVNETDKTASLETGSAVVKSSKTLGVKTGDTVVSVAATDKDIVVKANESDGKSSATVPDGGKVTIGSEPNAKTYTSKAENTRFVFDASGNVTLAAGTTGLSNGQSITGGKSGKEITNNGEGEITVAADSHEGKDTVTVPASGKVKIGDTEYENASSTEQMTIIVGADGSKLNAGSVKLDQNETINVGDKDTPVKNTGDKQIEVKSDGTVTVPAGGTLDIGKEPNTAKITNVTMDNTIFSIDKDGKTTVKLPAGGSVTINGVTYTDGGSGHGKLTIDENGKVTGAENVKVEISEEELKGADFTYELIPGVPVTVGKYTYTAPANSAQGDVTLKARTETTGDSDSQVTKALNPEITLKSADSKVDVTLKDNQDTRTTYTAANGDTKFAMSANDSDTTRIDLLDNSNSGANSALKFSDGKSHTVNGVTYTGLSKGTPAAAYGEYTVTYGTVTTEDGDSANRNTVSVESGSKVTAAMDANGTINIGSGKVGDKGFSDGMPFTAANSGASILIDNTKGTPEISGNGRTGLTPIYGKKDDGTTDTSKIVGYQATRYSGGSGSSSSNSSSVSVKSAKNGKITVSPSSASKGTTVTITAKPDSGYKLGSLTVTDKNGNTVKLTQKSENVYTFVMPAGGVTVEGIFVKTSAWSSCEKGEDCAIYPFADAQPTAWYHDGVHYCLDNGLMNGVSDDAFSPNGNITRGQIVTILWRQDGSPAVSDSSFTDVASGAYYAKAVAWAAKHGIVGGYGDGRFGPNDPITREQLAAILYRYAQFKGMDVSVGEDTNIMDFDDVRSISSYAVSAIQWACGSGVITGTSDTTLSPGGTATRAQAACLMQRFLTNEK